MTKTCFLISWLYLNVGCHHDIMFIPQRDCKMSALHQEVDLLEHTPHQHPTRQQQPPRPPPADVMQHLLGAASNLQRQRQDLQAQVLRPTVALPTVSVEQQVDACKHIPGVGTTCTCQMSWCCKQSKGAMVLRGLLAPCSMANVAKQAPVWCCIC